MRGILGPAVGCLLACWVVWPAVVRADEPAYYRQLFSELKLTEGSLQTPDKTESARRSGDWWSWPLLSYVVLDGPGEAYWSEATGSGGSDPEFSSEARARAEGLYVRAPKAEVALTGQLFYYERFTSNYRKVRFKIPADQAKADFRDAFFLAKERHYRSLLDGGIPGGAWFRHQMRLARAELNGTALARVGEAAERRPGASVNRDTSGFDRTYALFTGGRAVSENLQLDRAFTRLQSGSSDVPIDKLSGITVAEIDWTKLIAGKQPQLDPLAGCVPADQHVVFFPSFAAMLKLADEADRQGTPVLEAAEPRAEDFGVAKRYQRQLGLQTTALGRMLGPQVIASAALTGGDPYFRLGTDVALLLEAKDSVENLRTLLAGQIALNSAAAKQVTHSSGKLLGIEYQAWLSPARRVSSYLAAIDRAVVVTNSLPQLQRLIETHQGRQKPIAALDEYRFFRDRYRRGDASETALLFLSDATIRRWCGPQWRIADSRRTRDLAVLSEVQAAAVPQLVAGSAKFGPVKSVYPLSGGGPIELTPSGAGSPTAGTLEFLTPIGERPLKTVSRAEADAYEFWRNGYQRNFRWAFDPIALRLTLAGDRLAADLTVMPLIAASEYNTLIDLSRGVALTPESGDPHDTIAHVILALNRDSDMMKKWAGYATAFAPQLKVNPLSWLGKSVSLYVDDSPLWNELAKLTSDQQRNKWAEEKGWRGPIAVNIEIDSTLKAVAFLAALRAFVEQTSPGMLRWENLPHGEQGYVKISTTPRGAQQGLGDQKLAIYYALTSEALTISPNEQLIQRALDRAQTRFEARNDSKPAPPAGSVAPHANWLGQSVALNVEARALKALGPLLGSSYQTAMQRLAFGNLPILNEWKRRFPQHDPVDLHERLWGVRLVCPGGGQYVWNPRWQTMESTVYGHPGEPRLGPSAPPILGQLQGVRLGLSFEEHGLRAGAELLQKKPPGSTGK
ncbi:MAG TPA: hypothetical protein VIK18_17505 [Pirellulales bacterium]